jgi:predicted DNA-binding transcriptional regulator AlpA
MGRTVDLDDIIDAAGVAKVIGLSHRNGVYTYRNRHPDFPEPVLEFNRNFLWLRPDIEAWMRRRGEHQKP